MLTVTKVTDFRWTRSQRVQSKSVTSLRLQKRSPTLIVGPKEPCCLLAIFPRSCTARAQPRPASPFPLPPLTVQNSEAVWSIAKCWKGTNALPSYDRGMRRTDRDGHTDFFIRPTADRLQTTLPVADLPRGVTLYMVFS
ncbi:unnamed protein product (mitochondrion) [Arabidopsis thaliana]|nr:unnamed protein product [Arabidopsis thaliana]